MNMHSLVSARESIGYMEKSGANLSQSLKRLSTGIKVDAKDAGGLAVSTKMDSVITRTRTLSANVQNGMSFLESQDAAQSKLGAILTRMSELRVRYDDPTTNTSDGANLNREFKELQDDVRALAQKKFNGISLFSSGSDADSKLAIGANSANPSNIRDITRNQFFNSLLQTHSSGGPRAGSKNAFAKFGSFTDRTVDAIGGKASLTGDVVVNGVRGSANIPPVKGIATGTHTDLTINAQQGTFSTTVKGEQGTLDPFNLSGTPGTGSGGTTPTFSVTPTFGTTPDTIWATPRNFAGGTNGFDRMSPVFDSNDDIFIGADEDNEFYRLDQKTGSILKTYTMPGGKHMAWKVALADTSGDGTTDTVYATSEEGKLYAFNLDDTQKWSKTLNAETHCTPFVHSNGNVFVASHSDPGDPFGTPPIAATSGFIEAYDHTGTALTPLAIDGHFSGGFAEGKESVPGAKDGTLYLTGNGGANGNERALVAVKLDLSGYKSTIDLDSSAIGRVFGPPVVYTENGGDEWVAVNTIDRVADNSATTRAYKSDGTLNWSYAHGGAGNSHISKGGPAIGTVGGTVTVFAASSNGVVALQGDGSGGVSELWTYTGAGRDAGRSTPVFDATRNLVYVGVNDATKNVIALNATTGAEVWGYDTGDSSYSSPSLDSAGNVYIGNNNGDLAAISTWEGPVTNGVGSGYSGTAPTVTLDPAAPNLGTLQATATINAGKLDITFTGRASGPGAIGVTVVGGGGGPTAITPPSAVTKVSKSDPYDPAESAPAVRVIANSMVSLGATGTVTPPTGIDLSTGLVVLIDGDTDPAVGPISNPGSGPDGTFAAGEAPTHETTERRAGAGALTFNGTDDKIMLDPANSGHLNALIGGQDKLTISAWVYHTEAGDHKIVCKSPDTTVANHIYSLGITSGNKLQMRIGTTDPTSGTNTSAINLDGGDIPLNEWTHVAMTYDGAPSVLEKNVKSYINGQLDSEHDLTGNIRSSPDFVTIGNVHAKTGVFAEDEHFKGKLDDLGIWNVALDADHIKALAGPGNLTATASVNDGTDLLDPSKVLGTLTITPSSTATLATPGPFTIEVDDGVMRNPANFTTAIATTSQLYDAPGDTVGSTKNVTFSGGNEGNLAATATIRADGQLDINFTSGSPSGTGNITMTVDGGGFHLDNPLPQGDGNYVSGETPIFTITGLDSGPVLSATGTAAVITTGPDAGKLNVDLSGVQPTGTGNLTLSIADGYKAPANLLAVGSGYDFGPPPAAAETNPTVTVTGTDKGTLTTGTATIITSGPNAGKLNITFPTDKFPTGTGDLNLTIAAGTLRAPANLTGIGSGYDGTTPETAPNVSITDTTAGADIGSLHVLPSDVIVNNNGTLDITFGGTPTGTGPITLTIDDGLGSLADQTGGSGYVTGDTPAVTILDPTGNPLVAPGVITTTVNVNGTLTVDLSAVRTNVQGDHTVQITPGLGTTLQTPDPVTGIGAYHDPAGPAPAVTITGTDVGGVTVNTVTVNSDGTVDVSFAGKPSGTGPLAVTVSGGSGAGSNAVSSKYLLDIDGDLWDYSVSEFESFTKLVSDARAQNGAEQNSLSTFWELLSTNVNKLEQAAGRIKDADFAKEMTEVSKSQINTRSAAVMLGKQNRITSEALLTLQNLSNML
jgi:flagellin-like hook-associated protein FlgL